MLKAPQMLFSQYFNLISRSLATFDALDEKIPVISSFPAGLPSVLLLQKGQDPERPERET